MKRALIVLPFFLMVGCATAPKSVDHTKFAQTEIKSSGIIFDLNLSIQKDASIADECRITFKDSENGALYELPVHSGQTRQMLELPAGIYYTYRMDCRSLDWSLIEADWSQFRVPEGKIAMLAPIQIYLMADRQARSTFPKRKDQNDEAHLLFKQLNADQKSRVVSGYNLLPITEKVFAKNWKAATARVKLGADAKTSLKKQDVFDLLDFQTCYKEEDRVNPLWLGELRVAVSIVDDEVDAVDIAKGTHTFSNTFIECVKNKVTGMNASELPEGTTGLNLTL